MTGEGNRERQTGNRWRGGQLAIASIMLPRASACCMLAAVAVLWIAAVAAAAAQAPEAEPGVARIPDPPFHSVPITVCADGAVFVGRADVAWLSSRSWSY